MFFFLSFIRSSIFVSVKQLSLIHCSPTSFIVLSSRLIYEPSRDTSTSAQYSHTMTIGRKRALPIKSAKARRPRKKQRKRSRPVAVAHPQGTKVTLTLALTHLQRSRRSWQLQRCYTRRAASQSLTSNSGSIPLGSDVAKARRQYMRRSL